MDAIDDNNSQIYMQTIGSDSAICASQQRFAIAPLLEALNDQDSNVRLRAVRALGKIGTEAAVTVLLQALNHETGEVRGWAAWALGQIRSEALVIRLISALNHEASQVRIWATWALGKIGSPAAVAELIGALKHEDSQIRWRAASALGFFSGEAVVDGLLGALNDPDYYVRGRAASALGKIGSEVAVLGLVRSLNDSEFYVYGAATDALRHIGTEAVVPMGDYVALNSNLHQEQPTAQSNKLPTIFITSCAEASKHILCKTRGPLIKHLISIGSPGVELPQGYNQVPHRLRLEFDDIDTPDDDPNYVLATSEDICKVINFVPLISQDGGNVLIHCQAGISRSSAVALTICAVLLGAGKEEEALAMVLAARPQAVPNRWIVELADEALEREGKLVEVVQQHHDLLLVFEDYSSDDWDSL